MNSSQFELFVAFRSFSADFFRFLKFQSNLKEFVDYSRLFSITLDYSRLLSITLDYPRLLSITLDYSRLLFRSLSIIFCELFHCLMVFDNLSTILFLFFLSLHFLDGRLLKRNANGQDQPWEPKTRQNHFNWVCFVCGESIFGSYWAVFSQRSMVIQPHSCKRTDETAAAAEEKTCFAKKAMFWVAPTTFRGWQIFQNAWEFPQHAWTQLRDT